PPTDLGPWEPAKSAAKPWSASSNRAARRPKVLDQAARPAWETAAPRRRNPSMPALCDGDPEDPVLRPSPSGRILAPGDAACPFCESVRQALIIVLVSGMAWPINSDQCSIVIPVRRV